MEDNRYEDYQRFGGLYVDGAVQCVSKSLLHSVAVPLRGLSSGNKMYTPGEYSEEWLGWSPAGTSPYRLGMRSPISKRFRHVANEL